MATVNKTTLTMTHSPLAILWLGDCRRTEFAPINTALVARARVTTLPGTSDSELSSVDSSSSEFAPALVVVAQGFAGEFCEEDFERLRRRYPAAAIVRIAGTWCEGELRTSLPIFGAKRILAHHASPLLMADLARLERGFKPDWGSPATASEEESIVASIVESACASGPRIRVGIAASDAAVESWLIDLCKRGRKLGSTVVYSAAQDFAANVKSFVDRPDLILWDVPASREVAELELSGLSDRDASGKIVALASFPRREDLLSWRERGVVGVVAKPVSPAILPACLELFVEREKSRQAGDNSN